MLLPIHIIPCPADTQFVLSDPGIRSPPLLHLPPCTETLSPSDNVCYFILLPTASDDDQRHVGALLPLFLLILLSSSSAIILQDQPRQPSSLIPSLADRGISLLLNHSPSLALFTLLLLLHVLHSLSGLQCIRALDPSSTVSPSAKQPPRST